MLSNLKKERILEYAINSNNKTACFLEYEQLVDIFDFYNKKYDNYLAPRKIALLNVRKINTILIMVSILMSMEIVNFLMNILQH